jgi:hypothetical protein
MQTDWNRTLTAEELSLVDEWLGDQFRPEPPTAVYVLLLASGAVYVGISYAPETRLKQHKKSLTLAPENCVVIQIEDGTLPSQLFLAVHGLPEQAAVISCPSRREATLLEALLTDALAQAGVHVFGAGWDKAVDKWTRNEFKGAKIDDVKRLLDLVRVTVDSTRFCDNSVTAPGSTTRPPAMSNSWYALRLQGTGA